MNTIVNLKIPENWPSKVVLDKEGGIELAHSDFIRVSRWRDHLVQEFGRCALPYLLYHRSELSVTVVDITW